MERLSGFYKKCKVVIVGAGVSGITTAARLIAAGFRGDDIAVLEASNHIGGRVMSTSFEGYTVDLGAQWVHGEDGNVVYEMAKPEGIISDSASDFVKVQCVLSDKTFVDLDLTSRLFVSSIEIRDNIIEKSNGCFADYFIPRYFKFIDDEMPGLPDDIRYGYLEWLHQFQNSVDGSDSWHHTSVTSNVVYRECDGNSLIKWNLGGFSNIVQLIYNKFAVDKVAVENRIFLNKEVISMNWNEKYKQQPSNGVLLKCADGSVYLSECVVVTIPLGVLKRNYSTLFHPCLPKSKIQVIKGLGFGTVDKIFIKFPHRWWPEGSKGFSLLWRKQDLQNTDFIQGDMNWVKDIFGFYIVDGADKLLCGWVVGESAHNMESYSDECVLEVCYKLLCKFLAGHHNIPKPVAILRSRWHSDPYSSGSYSFRSVDSDHLDVSHGQLAEPLVNDSGRKVVFFAGEATHPYFFSTVHGAIETGFNQAENVISNLSHNIRVSTLAGEISTVSSSLSSEYTVIIVGAGVAGLGACKTLIDAGVTNVLLLEGQNRAGGRVQSVQFSGLNDSLVVRWLELGAHWLHGQYSDLHNIAQSHDLLSDIRSAEGLGQYLQENGVEIETSIVAEVSNKVADILENCEQFWSSNADPPRSVGVYLKERFLRYLDECSDSPQIRKVKLDLFDWHISSLGHLKRYHHKMFEPSLPSRLVKSIESIGYAVINKIFLCYDRSWWPKDQSGFQIVWSTSSINSDIKLLPEQEWMRDVTGFDVLSNVEGVILGWVGRGGAIAVEGLTETVVGEHCTYLLRHFMRNHDIPLPYKVFRSCWHSNRFICGGYSHSTVECDSDSDVKIDYLAQPVYIRTKNAFKHPAVMLAGEAVHETHFSTTHGAFESGQRQANEVLRFLKLK
ncbi:peroxisomal N(1)-acetyl-spermine/spermidine oxidase-like isoform X3 [Lycorma delicatula]|uniref:peroxisomal N(1)-acetyl-spermine/spermidine oxidase-like isoform X3 n=1 Tax=Lycorma delicatula TaxID=130591 RepID=UPI003F514578